MSTRGRSRGRLHWPPVGASHASVMRKGNVLDSPSEQLTAPGREGADDNTLPLTAAQRDVRARQTGGEPLLASETARNAYLDYEQIDTLLSLQRPRSNGAAELSFCVMGQVKELLFKLLHAEFVRARDELAADEPEAALWTLRRALPVQRLLVQTWDVLRAMSPAEFNEFRDALGSASGVQSYMYRRLEFVLGNKNPSMVALHSGVPSIAADVQADFRAPSLYD